MRRVINEAHRSTIQDMRTGASICPYVCYSCLYHIVFTETYTSATLLEVLGEQWCGGLADYFILSKHSGLGRQVWMWKSFLFLILFLTNCIIAYMQQAAFRSKLLRNRVVSISHDKTLDCSVSEVLQVLGSEHSQI